MLEERKLLIGVVHSIAGSTRVQSTFRGRADYSGATPMWLRNDALAAAAEFVLEVERRASERSTSVGTVCRFQIAPGSLTTIPGEVALGLDVRDFDSDEQRELVEKILNVASSLARRRAIEVEAELLSDQSPVLLHNVIQECLSAAAVAEGESFLSMSSGASHDAAHIAALVPTGMLFVPSWSGLSHSPDEWTESSDISKGAAVLARAIEDLANREDI